MEKKVQYKFTVGESFESKAKAAGIPFTIPVEHVYTYFEATGITGDAFVVLRLKESEGVRKLDMKVRNDKTGEWQHFESEISDSDQVKAILNHLGCKPIFTFHKNRRTWVGKNIRLDLDTTKELGTFLEAKFNSSNKLDAEQFLRDIGIEPESHDTRSIIEIYKEKYKE